MWYAVQSNIFSHFDAHHGVGQTYGHRTTASIPMLTIWWRQLL